MSWIVRILIIGALLCASFPSRAHGQIYSWHEADGSLVLSTTPRAGATKTYAVGTAGSNIRTTRPAQPPRAERFESLIAASAAEHNVRADLVRAVIQAESAFNPAARSHKGAMGLMQLMPATATELGVDDPYDPEQNIRGGVRYLRALLDQYSNNEELALAAYNAGPGAVDRYDGVPPYRETRDYIERIRNNATVRTRPSTAMYRKVEIVNGREVVTFTSKPSDGATLVGRRR
ncbi:MAG TPA: lytic transglycosylase domain-containing protein [Vicinamibacterales bacterium]